MGLLQLTAITDPGRRRRRNEDAYVVQPPLFAVADGMGGAQAGEIASRIAASVLRDSPGGSGTDTVAALIKEANRRVYEAAASDEARSGMGTTITAALVEEGAVHIGHVGDSRAYLVRDAMLEQLTDDHSLVAELVRSGRLSPEEAGVHPQRSVITRALGTDPDVDVDTFTIEAKPGDVFMICSDGLTSMVDDPRILELVEQNRASLDKTGKALVDAANRGGGEDNITIVAFEIGEATGEATETLPAVVDEQADDEDTLSGLEAVPAVTTLTDTTMLSRDELEALGDEEHKPERRVSPAVIALGAVGAVVILAALVVWSLSRSYFVGAQKDGHVAVYQGFPWNIVGGVRLYRMRYESPVLAGQLSQGERRKLFDHNLQSYGSAVQVVKRYEAEVVP
jgi:PPM family protein phosphatase